MKRRTILKTSILGATGTALVGTYLSMSAKPVIKKEVRQYNVIVCGAGPAGVAAALSSAMSGAKTLLIEKNGCLGGVWTAGALSLVIDHSNKMGLNKLFFKKLNDMNIPVKDRSSYVYDVENMKYMLEQLCLEHNVDIRLHTRLADVAVTDKEIKYIETISYSGKEYWSAPVFIDCTGNGDLAAYSGCSFDLGHPVSKKTQPMTLMALLTGIDTELAGQYLRNNDVKAKYELLKYLKSASFSPSYELPTLFDLGNGLYSIMMNHIYGKSGLSSEDVTYATLKAREQIHEMVSLLQKTEVFKDIRLVATGEQIGIREGRRIEGLYMVTKEDLLSGFKYNDNICTVTFHIDVHSLDPKDGKGVSDQNKIKTKHYGIPVRSIIAKDIDNLLIAGRCISGDFYAHSSYRVSGNSVSMGEASGVIAAYISLNNNRLKSGTFEKLKNKVDNFRKGIMSTLKMEIS